MNQVFLRDLAFLLYKGRKLKTISAELNLPYSRIVYCAKKIYKEIDPDPLFTRIGFICYINSFVLYAHQVNDEYIKKVIAYHIA